MESEMKMPGPSKKNTNVFAWAPEAILVVPMSRMHLDAVNKNKNKEGDISDEPPSSRKAQRRRVRWCDDEERQSLPKKDHLSRRQDGAEELTALRWCLRQQAHQDPGMRTVFTQRFARPSPTQRPASNGYSGRASIWAPEGFNPLLDLSNLIDSREQQREHADHGDKPPQ